MSKKKSATDELPEVLAGIRKKLGLRSKPANKPSRTMRYVRAIPRTIPEGKILVHNSVTPVHPIGLNGFRAWLDNPADDYVPCDCGWAENAPGGHYRVKAK